MFEDFEDLEPIGYYHVGISYLDAAEMLVDNAKLRFDAPIRALIAHAWEVILKACLRVQGISVAEARKRFGHNLEKAFAAVDKDRFAELNLAGCAPMLTYLNAFHLERLNFYPKAGAFRMEDVKRIIDESQRLRVDRSIASRLCMPTAN